MTFELRPFPDAAASRRDETVRFWAERSPQAYIRSLAIVLASTLPIAFMAPDAYILGAAFAVALSWLNARNFRLELTGTHLRLKAGAMIPAVLLPLSAIAEARAESAAKPDGSRPVGKLVLRLVDGPEIPIGDLFEPAEAAEAIRTLKSGRVRDGDRRAAA